MAQEESQAIGRVYAEALFALADASRQTKVVREELDGLAELVTDDEDFAAFLASPAIGREQKTTSLKKIFAGRVSELVMAFLQVANGKNRLGLLREVRDAFCDLQDAQAGRVKGTLVTAIELAHDELVRLTEQIGRALRKKVSLEARVDPEILGGMVVTVDGTVLDASVEKNIERFSQQLLRRAGQEVRTGG